MTKNSMTIMLDIKKAFDTVSHDVLLSKLWSCGVTGACGTYYLSNRVHCVTIEGQTSEWPRFIWSAPG